MANFKSLHSADLHLDSPLLGLARKNAGFAQRVDLASRAAYDQLVDLAIRENCRFVVVAGDVFDGDLRDYSAGLYFLSGITRLRAAGIRVVLIAGNHDAENRFFSKLEFEKENVHFFGHREAGHVVIDDVDVVLHGRSFGQREVTDNIALTYQAPHRNLFNIGVLHTACAGSEGAHAAYAPSSVPQLVNHGYDYWALGHVHTRAMLHEHPHVVYPGNLQGRNPRETGPKGATIVEVSDGAVVACTHHDLDQVRWASADVDIEGAMDRTEIVERARETLSGVGAAAGGRPVALRLAFTGETALHGQLLLKRTSLQEDIEALIELLPTEIWLEKMVLKTRSTHVPDTIDPTVSGRLGAEIRRLAGEADLVDLLEKSLAEVRSRLPAQAGADELFARIRQEAPARALELALALVGSHAD